MADILGGYLVAKALKRQGVECIFMLCGGHITPIYMGCNEEGIRLIDVRHEQSAGYAADAWARVTKKPGVAMVTAAASRGNRTVRLRVIRISIVWNLWLSFPYVNHRHSSTVLAGVEVQGCSVDGPTDELK